MKTEALLLIAVIIIIVLLYWLVCGVPESVKKFWKAEKFEPQDFTQTNQQISGRLIGKSSLF